MSNEENEKKAKKQKSGGKKWTFLLIVGSLLLIVFTQMTYLFIIVGLLPAIVAFYIDTTESRSTFHTVFACNFSGVLPFVAELNDRGNKSSDMQMMLGDMDVLLVMYLSAAFGWILVKGTPYFASLLIDSLNNRQIAKYKNRQKRLLREWGQSITQTPFQ